MGLSVVGCQCHGIDLTYEGRRSFGMVALSSPTTPGVMESTKQKCWKLSRKGKHNSSLELNVLGTYYYMHFFIYS